MESSGAQELDVNGGGADDENTTVDSSAGSSSVDHRPCTPSNPYSPDNRLRAEAADRSRCYPWTKYIKSQAPGFELTNLHQSSPNFGVSAGLDKSLVMWDLKIKDVHYTSNGRHQMRGHSNEILCMDVLGPTTNASHPTAITAGWDDELRVWNLETGYPQKLIQGVHEEEVIGVRFIPFTQVGMTNQHIGDAADGSSTLSSAVTASADGSIAVTDLNSGVCVSRIPGAHQGGVTCLDLDDDGRQTVTGGSRDKEVRVWDLETSQMISAIPAVSDCSPIDQSTRVDHSRDHSSNTKAVGGSSSASANVASALLAMTTRDSEGKTFNSTAGRSGGLRGHCGALTSVCSAEHGKRILSASHDSTVALWDLVSGKRVREFRGHKGWVLSAALSKHHGRVAVSGGEDRAVRVWDVGSGRCLEAFTRGHNHWVSAVDVSGNGACAMSGARDGTVRLWDLKGTVTDGLLPPSSAKLNAHRSAINCCKLLKWTVPKPKGGPGIGDVM